MNGMEAVLWITSACLGLRKSQTKTFADVVAVATQVGRVSLSELGRLLADQRGGAGVDHGDFHRRSRLRPHGTGANASADGRCETRKLRARGDSIVCCGS